MVDAVVLDAIACNGREGSNPFSCTNLKGSLKRVFKIGICLGGEIGRCTGPRSQLQKWNEGSNPS